MKLIPLGERLVIKEVEVEETTSSGIVLTGALKDKPKIAEVISIGKAVEENEKTKDLIKIGDRVVYSEFGATNVKLDGEEYMVIKFNDILAIVE